MVFFHLFFLLNATIPPKIKVHTDLFLLFVHHHSTKKHGPQWFIFFMCTRPFDKNIWSSFINSFFCARPFDQKLRSTLIYFFICTRPFDQKLGSSLIYFFYLHTTIRPNYRVLFHLFFLKCTTIRPKIRVHIDLFFICTRPFDQIIGSSFIHFILSLVHDHSTKD